MKLIDRYEFDSRRAGDPFRMPRFSDAIIHKCQCRCVCDNERLRNQSICNYCFLCGHDNDSLIGPPKPSRLAEQRLYVDDDGDYEIR